MLLVKESGPSWALLDVDYTGVDYTGVEERTLMWLHETFPGWEFGKLYSFTTPNGQHFGRSRRPVPDEMIEPKTWSLESLPQQDREGRFDYKPTPGPTGRPKRNKSRCKAQRKARKLGRG